MPNNPLDRAEALLALAERLRARTPSRHSYLYGEEGHQLINPDGPEAAAEIERLRAALEEVHACMLDGGDGVKGDFGWNISRLTKARLMIRAALANSNEPGKQGE